MPSRASGRRPPLCCERAGGVVWSLDISRAPLISMVQWFWILCPHAFGVLPGCTRLDLPAVLPGLAYAAANSSHAAVGWKLLEQLADGLRLSGQNQTRRDFIKRLEHETPLMCSGMRQHQFVAAPHLLTECNQIQVNRPWLVVNLLWPAPEGALEHLKLF